MENQVDEFTVRLCVPCKGILLSHPDLVQILERSWRAVTEEFAENATFNAPDGWQDEPAGRCPGCGDLMEKYGYMGLAAIQIDRCNRCAQVWLDAKELEAMMLALAKTNYRSERARVRERDANRDILSGTMRGLAATRGEAPTDGAAPFAMSAASILLSLLRK